MTAERRIIELGIVLPTESAPAGNYASTVRTGNLLFVSGKTALPVGGQAAKGRLGKDYSAQEGYALARSACTNMLASVRLAAHSMDKVVRVVELHGALCTTEGFEDHAKVLDGASDLLAEVFGPAGIHARSVIGVYSLRNGAPLTLKGIFEIKD